MSLKVHDVENFGRAVDSADIAEALGRTPLEIRQALEGFGVKMLIEEKCIYPYIDSSRKTIPGYWVSHDGLCVTFGALVGEDFEKACLLSEWVKSFDRFQDAAQMQQGDK